MHSLLRLGVQLYSVGRYIDEVVRSEDGECSCTEQGDTSCIESRCRYKSHGWHDGDVATWFCTLNSLECCSMDLM